MQVKHLVIGLVLGLGFISVPSVSQADGLAMPRGLSARMVRIMSRHPVKARALASVCNRVEPLNSLLVKSELSNHITNPGDPRSGGYTLVCASKCPNAFPATVYYSDGTEAFRFGYYGTFSGNGRPRAYCGVGGAARCYVNTVYNIARRKGNGRSLYLKIRGKNCMSFNGAPGARNGGV